LWGLGILVLLGAARLVLRMFTRDTTPTAGSSALKAGAETSDGSDLSQPEQPRTRMETHVFDYSSLHEEISGDSAMAVQGLRDQMVNIESPQEHVPCVNYSTFRETPSSGTERIKYSLESEPLPSGLSYVLHV